MNTHRAYANADTQIVCWVRNDADKRDLRASVLVAKIYSYDRRIERATITATQASATDAVRFTVTDDLAGRLLHTGLYRFEVRAGDEVVYSGLLEIV